MSERDQRKGDFKIDHSFEDMLGAINANLSGLEQEAVNAANPSDLPPLVFFCYAPRTGSTMITQYLARTGDFNYISNFIARFWEAPYTALQLEQKLGLRDMKFEAGVESSYGATASITDPHEFGFFWNKLLTNPNHHRINANEVDPELKDFFIRQVNAMRSTSDKPFFFKNGIAGYNADIWADWFPEAKFIMISREPLYVAQSLYVARQELYEDTTTWWSLRPENWQEIVSSTSDEFGEIALQLDTITTGIKQRLAPLGDRVLHVAYEDFCQAPASTFEKIYRHTGIAPSVDALAHLPNQIEVRRHRKVNDDIFERLKAAVSPIPNTDQA